MDAGAAPPRTSAAFGRAPARPARRGASKKGRAPANHAGERRGAVTITPIAWQAEDEIRLEDWLGYGRRLGLMGRGAGWLIGDWLRYGNARYGERYARAARITGYDPQTLRNMVYVAGRFEVSRRRDNLSWGHHAEVAALDVAGQEDWLDRAERDRLSVRSLREELRRDRGARGAADGNARPGATATAHAVVCPACGYRFVGSGDDNAGPAPRAAADGATGAGGRAKAAKGRLERRKGEAG